MIGRVIGGGCDVIWIFMIGYDCDVDLCDGMVVVYELLFFVGSLILNFCWFRLFVSLDYLTFVGNGCYVF